MLYWFRIHPQIPGLGVLCDSLVKCITLVSWTPQEVCSLLCSTRHSVLIFLCVCVCVCVCGWVGEDIYRRWLVVFGFNTTLTAKVISWRSMTHMCFLAFSHKYLRNFSFQSHRLLFPHASAEVRGENTPERKVASTRDQTHNHQVISPKRSPLSHPGGAIYRRCSLVLLKPMTYVNMVLLGNKPLENMVGKGEIAHNKQFLLFSVFSNRLDNFLPFSSNLKLSSTNTFSLEESKICHLVMG